MVQTMTKQLPTFTLLVKQSNCCVSNELRLIVGLGNPGTEYAQTRHNAGFWYIERLAQQHGIRLNLESRFHGLTGRGHIDGHEVRLLLPNTFMNRSGQSVVPFAKFFQIAPQHLLIAHDELDMPAGAIRLKTGGSLCHLGKAARCEGCGRCLSLRSRICRTGGYASRCALFKLCQK